MFGHSMLNKNVKQQTIKEVKEANDEVD